MKFRSLFSLFLFAHLFTFTSCSSDEDSGSSLKNLSKITRSITEGTFTAPIFRSGNRVNESNVNAGKLGNDKRSAFESDNTTLTVVFDDVREYGANGLVSRFTIQVDGVVRVEEIYEYNNNDISSYTFISSTNHIRYDYVYAGNTVTSTGFVSNDDGVTFTPSRVAPIRMTFDSRDNMIAKTDLPVANVPISVAYTYDTNDNVTSITSSRDGNFNFTYDLTAINPEYSVINESYGKKNYFLINNVKAPNENVRFYQNITQNVLATATIRFAIFDGNGTISNTSYTTTIEKSGDKVIRYVINGAPEESVFSFDFEYLSE